MGIALRNIWILLLFFVVASTYGQELHQVHKIDGVKYYLHLVEKGNTLYGISKQYNVSVERIEKANTEALSDGLKENQTLLIPVTSDNKKTLTDVKQTEGFLLHKVRPKETLFSVSKKYDIPLEELIGANPELRSSGLQGDSEIKIPIKAADVDSQTTQPAAQDSLETHTVVAGDTPYSIAKKYDVSLEELGAANPSLQILSIGSKVRIPGTAKPKPKVIKQDTSESEGFEVKAQDFGSVFHVALLLPIQPVFPDSTQTNSFQISGVNRVAVEYLRGFQFALDSLKDRYPASVRVKVFSMSNDSASIKRFIGSSFYDSVDIAIGPFYSSQFEYLADILADSGVIAICPINKPSKILFKRPNAVKTSASESMQLHGLANYLASQYLDSNLVLVNSNKFQDTQNLDFFKQELANAVNQPDTVTDGVIPEIQLWDINSSSLGMRFKDSGNYILIVPSKDQVFVTRLIGGLYDFMLDSKGKYTFQIIGLESWQTWQEGLDIRQLQALKLTMPISNHIDLQDSPTHNLYRAYYNSFGFEPLVFSIQGFDHCHYLLQSLSYNPEGWFNAPESISFHGLINDFNFVRVLDDSGVENQTVKFYQIENYRQKLIGQWPLEEKQ